MMKVTVFVFVLCYIGLFKAQSVSGGCNITLKNDLPKKNDPVYLVKNSAGNLELSLPDNGSIILKNQQDFILACTGSKNSLIASGAATTNTKCSSDANVLVGDKAFPTANLNCSSRAMASVLITDTKCVDQNSVIIQLGFQVDNGWFPLVNICHNINDANSLWSRSVLYGSRLAGKVIQSNRPGFSRGDKRLYDGFNPDDTYSQNNEMDVFKSIYGASSNYIVPDKQLYLARGHLSPDADFLFASWQMLTYFYVNVAPQWQSINAGNWLGVENNARKLAINLAADLSDITGTHKVLKLPDENGTMREAYLQGNRLPVPELTWKFLQNPNDNSCIVLIAVNNPYLTSPPDTVCPDICAANGWPAAQKDYSKGYVYCCDYNSFKAVAPQVPSATCTSVLKFK